MKGLISRDDLKYIILVSLLIVAFPTIRFGIRYGVKGYLIYWFCFSLLASLIVTMLIMISTYRIRLETKLDEIILRASLARFMNEGGAGVLFLTSQRLYFKTYSLTFHKAEFEIQLQDITKIDTLTLSRLMNTGLRVESGSTFYTFSVSNSKGWKLALSKAV
jgi:hypothetical protein